MANRFVKGGAELGMGLVGGILDQVGAEQDAKNIAANITSTGKTGNMLKQWGTYVNYAIPVIELGLAGFDVVKDASTQAAMVTQAGQLLGAKLTRNFTMSPFGTKKNYTLTFSSTPSQWTREGKGPAKQIVYTPSDNPGQIVTVPAIPTVQPQSTLSTT